MASSTSGVRPGRPADGVDAAEADPGRPASDRPRKARSHLLLLAAAVLFLFEAASGYAIYLSGGWTGGKQVLVLVHTYLGLPFIPLFAYFTSSHLNRTLRRRRAGGAFLLLTIVGLFVFILFNYPIFVIPKYGAILAYFVFLADRKVRRYCLLGAVAFTFLVLLNPLPAFSELRYSGDALNLMALFLLWIAYIWRPIRDERALSTNARQNLLGATTSVGVGMLVATGLLLILGSALYSGGRVALIFHRAAGLVVPLTATAHLGYYLGWGRGERWRAIARVRWPSWAVALGGAVLLLAGAGSLAARYETPPGAVEPDASYQRSRFGNPLFGPSLASTSTGTLLAPSNVTTASSCANERNCHAAIGRQWESSAHHRAASSPAFRRAFQVAREELGSEGARLCAGCHMPSDLLTGNIDPGRSPSPEYVAEGVGCSVCHSISHVDESRGNAAYTVAVKQRYLYPLALAAGAPLPNPSQPPPGEWDRSVAGLLLRTTPNLHVELFADPLLRDPRFCGSCHKLLVHEELNGFGTIPLLNEYDSWAAGPYAVPDAEGDVVRCQDCHMPYLEANDYEVQIRDHRFLAGNTYLPHAAGDDRQLELTRLFLRGETERILELSPLELYGFEDVPRYPREDRWPRGPMIGLELRDVPGRARPGEDISLTSVTTNRRVGHVFPTGNLDLLQVWLELRLLDENGSVIHSQGGPDAAGRLPPDAVRLGADELDASGAPIAEHRVWEIREVANKRVLEPYASIEDELRVRVPDTARGRIELVAVWRYRNVSQKALDELGRRLPFAPGERSVPIVDLVTTRKPILLVPGDAGRG